ncbi:hypothetical protein C8R43DRAFT_946389 [Mycena crocata]|nr:hypothetical protein C8R43DRAFT_946389 [Mycena crocata]
MYEVGISSRLNEKSMTCAAPDRRRRWVLQRKITEPGKASFANDGNRDDACGKEHSSVQKIEHGCEKADSKCSGSTPPELAAKVPQPPMRDETGAAPKLPAPAYKAANPTPMLPHPKRTAYTPDPMEHVRPHFSSRGMTGAATTAWDATTDDAGHSKPGSEDTVVTNPTDNINVAHTNSQTSPTGFKLDDVSGPVSHSYGEERPNGQKTGDQDISSVVHEHHEESRGVVPNNNGVTSTGRRSSSAGVFSFRVNAWFWMILFSFSPEALTEENASKREDDFGPQLEAQLVPRFDLNLSQIGETLAVRLMGERLEVTSG